MHIDDQVIFIHCPRTAGTATRRALLRGRDPNRDIPLPGGDPSPWTQNQKHMFADVARQRIAPEVWDTRFKLSIVRHPLDRLVSLYGMFRRPVEQDNMDRISAYSSIPYKLDKMMRTLKHPDLIHDRMTKEHKFQICQLGFAASFKEWLLVFCEFYKWNNCRYLDPDLPLTRIPQSRWFDGLDRVFSFERLDELSAWLVDRGYSSLAQENATQHRPWRSYYDAETTAWAEKVFAEDIERFGY